MKFKPLLFLLIIINVCGCSNFGIEYDKKNNSIRTCSDLVFFENLTLYEVGNQDHYHLVNEYVLTDENKASSILFLESVNDGYSSYDYKLKPKTKYFVTTTYMNMQADMYFFTNEYAIVDSIINENKCK
jgi:hypothetical protein